MKLPSAAQVRALDKITINKNYSASIDLMEHASSVFVNWFKSKYPNKNRIIHVFCGTGNNGGDGLAIARMLNNDFYPVKVYYCEIGKNSIDNAENLQALPFKDSDKFQSLEENDPIPNVGKDDLLIDALFGSGINREITGYWASLIKFLNKSKAEIIAVDLPSGLYEKANLNDVMVRADRTLSFEFPKLPFLLPSYADVVGGWEMRSIGLDKEAIQSMDCNHFYIDQNLAASLLKKRKKFSHKGSYGHALLIMSKYGMVGAALLAGRSCLRAGTGLVSIHVPRIAYQIIQTALPEAIVSVDQHEYHFTTAPNLNNYSAVGIGCGLGQESLSVAGLKQVLGKLNNHEKNVPLLLDADALNILANHEEIWDKIPAHTIITPHPRECERLFGKAENDYDQLEALSKLAKLKKIYIVLKRAHTAIFCSDGTIYFNSTGNPGLATAGSGDVLSGIITGLLAQKYDPKSACILGVYLHGLAADLAVNHVRGEEALIASDVIEFLGNAFLKTKAL